LKNITPEDISRALDECLDKFAWPPDVAEFKQLAQSYSGSSRIPWAHEVFEKASSKKKNPNVKVELIIEAGAVVCRNLKELYPELNWYQIADKFTALKKKSRPFYPGFNDLELCEELKKYSKQDLMDAFSLEKVQ